MSKRLFPALLLLVLSFPVAASAQQPPPPGGGAAPPPPGGPRGVDKGIEVGAFLHGMSADPILGYFYKEHQGVSGTTIGGFFMKRSPGGSRLLVDVGMTTVSSSDGTWLSQGK